MCGDGTNDVGALKRAHVGISIVSNPEAEDSARQRRRPEDASWGENDESTVVHLGDASIASPFTSKSSSIQIVKQLVRQGRCTLVTTIQMYKILGVNCLITAYYLSTLYIHGVKNGDQQLTVVGQLGLAMFFLFLSYARSSQEARWPNARRQPFVERDDPAMHPDGKFAPNGHPFMASFWEHKLLSRSALLAYVVLALAVTDIVPAMNELLELVPMPTIELQRTVALLMIADTAAVLALEALIQTSSRWWTKK
ncbi:hypothetical protein PINS_up024481 [Pythium insidiosum]|nr:hypothetical protein PINS_up024481 [Pythium insidiosum]